MSDKPEKVFYTIDHANKLREGRRDFDPYRFWMKQVKHHEEIEARARCEGHNPSSKKDKQQLA